MALACADEQKLRHVQVKGISVDFTPFNVALQFRMGTGNESVGDGVDRGAFLKIIITCLKQISS